MQTVMPLISLCACTAYADFNKYQEIIKRRYTLHGGNAGTQSGEDCYSSMQKLAGFLNWCLLQWQ